MKASLVNKYNIAGPRYTSYPTVPYWEESSFTTEKWLETLQKSYIESNAKEGISLYIHLPFCESLCTFCACNKRITKNHAVENSYLQTLLKEWQLYLSLFEEKPVIKELHLGGGTPTFFSAEHLKILLESILDTATIHPKKEFSFEGHPNNTTYEHLKTLYQLGFKRVSFGVQDYDEKVQKAINRIQPYTHVEQVTRWAREIGYTSISHDLVFGLPFQTLDAVIHTIEKTKQLQPDRLAFYSYAHVPWLKGNGQRGFDENDLPKGEEKRKFYEKGKALLEKLNYKEIGMDHFALEEDSMYKAMKNKNLHRNFMGYTSSKTQVMIGLGVSSISDGWYAFAQNEKTLEAYKSKVNNGEFPVYRGHILNDEDTKIRKHILEIMCNMQTNFSEKEFSIEVYTMIFSKLEEFVEDDLIEIQNDTLTVKENGRPFVRNICMAFDIRMLRKEPETRLFSMTV